MYLHVYSNIGQTVLTMSKLLLNVQPSSSNNKVMSMILDQTFVHSVQLLFFMYSLYYLRSMESPQMNHYKNSWKATTLCWWACWIDAEACCCHHMGTKSILELFPIYLLMEIFGRLMSNSNILFLCDNKAVMDIINKQSSKDENVKNITRPLITWYYASG